MRFLTVIEYSLSFGNTGSGFMICQFAGASVLANNTVRYSVSIGDGYDAVNSGALELYSSDSTHPASFVGNTVRNTPCWCRFYALKTINLPRQAWDKQRKS
jgi:hypothetical protein